MAKAKSEVVKVEMRDLVEEINTLFAQFEAYMRMSLQLAIKIGGRLVEAKQQIPHGGWDSWIQVNLPFGYRQARRYISVYENREELLEMESQGVNVTLKNAQQLLTHDSSEEEVDEAIQEDVISELEKSLALKSKEVKNAARKMDKPPTAMAAA